MRNFILSRLGATVAILVALTAVMLCCSTFRRWTR